MFYASIKASICTLTVMTRAYFTTVIDGVLCVERACDKQT